MPIVVEYVCVDCGMIPRGAWSGEEVPRAVYCGRCGSKMVNTEGADLQTHKQTKVCDTCEKEYEAKKPWQKYCSDGCRWKAWSARHPRT